MSSLAPRAALLLACAACVSQTPPAPVPEPATTGADSPAPPVRRDATPPMPAVTQTPDAAADARISAADGPRSSPDATFADVQVGIVVDAPRTDAAPIADAAADAPSTAPASAGCGSKTAPPDGLVNITVAGAQRSYYVHPPRGYQADKPWPLLFMFHGSTHSGRDYES